MADITNGGSISAAFVELLREQAAAKLGGAMSPPPQTAVQPSAVPAPPAPPPPPDRFGSCPFNPEDFMIGGKQYTPQSFLDEGFGGSTDRAVPDLRQRLTEARDIAEKIAGNALLEVQRQARVLSYFECRQKIEQASAAPK
jgi:hypothetical protein